MNYKYFVIVGDGMSDRKIKELGYKTPLEVARKTNIDTIVKHSIVGLTRNIPEGMEPGSAVANLSILGLDPKKYFKGRAPFEAANLDLSLSEKDVVYRTNFITLKDGRMESFTAKQIDDNSAQELIGFINKESKNSYKFYYGKGYRNLLILKNGPINVNTYPPHNITGKNVKGYMPSGSGAEKIIQIIKETQLIIEKFKNRYKRKMNVNSIWLWGQGRSFKIPSFKSMFGMNGALISAVSLLNGIGKLMKMKIISVPGATGYYDTDYKGKAEYALKIVEKYDFVFIHIEAPDEAGHEGNLKQKIRAIEKIDKNIVGKILRTMKGRNFRLLFLPDHSTPIRIMRHTNDYVPFLIYDSTISINSGNIKFSEIESRKSKILLDKGHNLLGKYFLVTKTQRRNIN